MFIPSYDHANLLYAVAVTCFIIYKNVLLLYYVCFIISRQNYLFMLFMLFIQSFSIVQSRYPIPNLHLITFIYYPLVLHFQFGWVYFPFYFAENTIKVCFSFYAVFSWYTIYYYSYYSYTFRSYIFHLYTFHSYTFHL